jgi:non-ribosomal peptide synthetase component F
MPESTLLHELILCSGLMGLGLQRGERVAIYLEKRFETVIASFGAPAAGAVFVPLNPCSSPNRWASSCAIATCVCWSHRPNAWRCWPIPWPLPDLRHVVVTDGAAGSRAGRSSARAMG